MSSILHMPLHFEVDGEEILEELVGRRFSHAPSVRHDPPADKLDERGKALHAILQSYSRAIGDTPAVRYAFVMLPTSPLESFLHPTGEGRRSMTGICRIEQDARRGWRVTLQRQHRIYTRNFSDHRYGGTAQALDAAQTYRDDLLAQHPHMTRRAQCAILKKHNRS